MAMDVDLVAGMVGVAAVCLAGAGALNLGRRSRRRSAGSPPVSPPKTWRILRDDEEIATATSRALADEQRSVQSAGDRVRRYQQELKDLSARQVPGAGAGEEAAAREPAQSASVPAA
jgi:hypothetical protein